MKCIRHSSGTVSEVYIRYCGYPKRNQWRASSQAYFIVRMRVRSELEALKPAFRPKIPYIPENFYLHLSFSNGSCNAGVFDTLWWWWWCWLDASWCKWFKLLLPDDMRPVIADETLTADATESCKLWWLCKWSVALPLFVPGTKSCRHSPWPSDILWSPRSIFPNWNWIFRLLSAKRERIFD